MMDKMQLLDKKNTAKVILWGLLAPLLFIGGLGRGVPLEWWVGLGLVLMIGSVVLALLYSGMSLPWGWWSYVGFLIFWGIYSGYKPLSTWAMAYWGLWVMGAIVWVTAYMFRKEWRKQLYNFVLVLACLFTGGLVLTLVWPHLTWPGLGPLGLVTADSAFRNHYHLGDWWMILVIIAGWEYYLKRKKRDILIVGLGLLLMLFSQSRSAWIGLLVAGLAAGVGLRWPIRYRNLWRAIIGAIVLILVGMSSVKGVISSRPYYYQAFAGFLANPMGIGMDRFGIISGEVDIAKLGAGFSYYTHNLFLEFLVGLGIFALAFMVWFGVQVYRVITSRQEVRIFGYSLAFLALSVNFMLDTTYIIPTMVIIWFILLGLAQN